MWNSFFFIELMPDKNVEKNTQKYYKKKIVYKKPREFMIYQYLNWFCFFNAVFMFEKNWKLGELFQQVKILQANLKFIYTEKVNTKLTLIFVELNVFLIYVVFFYI